MISALIVSLSVAMAVVFVTLYATRPELRRQIEAPKYTFQDQLRRYDRRRGETQTTHEVNSHDS